MAKTLTIGIKSANDALEEFRSAFKSLESGQAVPRHAGVYFTSVEAARMTLTARDSTRVLALLEQPPRPPAALRAAAKRRTRR